MVAMLDFDERYSVSEILVIGMSVYLLVMLLLVGLAILDQKHKESVCNKGVVLNIVPAGHKYLYETDKGYAEDYVLRQKGESVCID